LFKGGGRDDGRLVNIPSLGWAAGRRTPLFVVASELTRNN
jgi:hypothetical protein